MEYFAFAAPTDTPMRKGIKKIDIACQECKSRGSSLFAGICAHDLTSISQNKSCTQYKKGQMLFHEGTRPLGVYCINAGKVKVYKIGHDGKEQIIHVASNGNLLGYRAMLSEESYPVSAETLEEATVCFVPKHDFLQVLDGSHELHDTLLKAACKELGVMADNMTNMAQKSVRERLAVTLLMLRDTYGMDVENGPIEINLTREDLANIVGTATETLIRLLHDFKEEELIETKGRKIIVKQPDALVKVANIY